MDNDASVTKQLVFGSPKPNVKYSERRAAYVVIICDGDVAMVKSKQEYFLPGGGSLPSETPEETIMREVDEELALRVRLLHSLGEVTQYFYSATDGKHYKMSAVFFAGEFTDDVGGGTGEHQLDWWPVTEVEQACFH